MKYVGKKLVQCLNHTLHKIYTKLIDIVILNTVKLNNLCNEVYIESQPSSQKNHCFKISCFNISK